ncbi:hypothetical protein OPV22_024995 [Ensete ventricosum]|uniref:Uncharacterized protein n=1 Tax=Ensete ventricosum TaxID=4639 RepID=A0AAV8QEF4_ENSVE|nr:hypothetical protein OPV22_024995 [Ensete ventricosum]
MVKDASYQLLKRNESLLLDEYKFYTIIGQWLIGRKGVTNLDRETRNCEIISDGGGLNGIFLPQDFCFSELPKLLTRVDWFAGGEKDFVGLTKAHPQLRVAGSSPVAEMFDETNAHDSECMHSFPF